MARQKRDRPPQAPPRRSARISSKALYRKASAPINRTRLTLFNPVGTPKKHNGRPKSLNNLPTELLLKVLEHVEPTPPLLSTGGRMVPIIKHHILANVMQVDKQLEHQCITGGAFREVTVTKTSAVPFWTHVMTKPGFDQSIQKMHVRLDNAVKLGRDACPSAEWFQTMRDFLDHRHLLIPQKLLEAGVLEGISGLTQCNEILATIACICAQNLASLRFSGAREDEGFSSHRQQFPWGTANIWEAIWESIPDLKELRISMWSLPYRHPLETALNNTSIRAFRLDNAGDLLWFDPSWKSNLTQLTYSNIYSLHQDQLHQLFRVSPNLEELKIDTYYRDTFDRPLNLERLTAILVETGCPLRVLWVACTVQEEREKLDLSRLIKLEDAILPFGAVDKALARPITQWLPACLKRLDIHSIGPEGTETLCKPNDPLLQLANRDGISLKSIGLGAPRSVRGKPAWVKKQEKAFSGLLASTGLMNDVRLSKWGNLPLPLEE